MNSGVLIWITGFAGSGKTTIGKMVVDRLKEKSSAVVHLDGDELRKVLGGQFGYSIKDRISTAKIYCRLASELTKQGITVVMSTISLFHEIHALNRKLNSKYIEVFLEVNIDELHKRNQKNLYTKGSQVMGIHQAPEIPKNPDLIIKNNSLEELQENCEIIVAKVIKQWENC